VKIVFCPLRKLQQSHLSMPLWLKVGTHDAEHAKVDFLRKRDGETIQAQRQAGRWHSLVDPVARIPEKGWCCRRARRPWAMHASIHPSSVAPSCARCAFLCCAMLATRTYQRADQGRRLARRPVALTVVRFFRQSGWPFVRWFLAPGREEKRASGCAL
jgi:hypothetical protein